MSFIKKKQKKNLYFGISFKIQIKKSGEQVLANNLDLSTGILIQTTNTKIFTSILSQSQKCTDSTLYSENNKKLKKKKKSQTC